LIKQEENHIYLYCAGVCLLDVLHDSIDVMYANSDRSIHGREVFDSWELTAICGDGCTLICTRLLQAVNVSLSLQVRYTVKGGLAEKEITCFQNNTLNLYIGLTQEFIHTDTKQIWSFDAVENREKCIYGGYSRQAFPAAGMVLNSGEVVGLLMDTGAANGWSRWHLRRTAGGNAPVVTAYDPVLIGETERGGVCFRTGQYYPTYEIAADCVKNDGVTVFGRKGYHYALEFDCKTAACAVTVRLGGEQKLTRIWEEAGRQVLLLPACEKNGAIEVRWETDNPPVFLQCFEQKREPRPWHQLEQARRETYRFFIYADRFEVTLRNLRKYAQIRLAQALDFSGTTAEKILYADFRMLNWLAEPGLRKPLCVPSIDYFEMYFRDVFWSVNAVEDRELNQTIFSMIKNTIDDQNWVDNIITPYFGSIEKVDNELNYLYVIWSYLNQKRYGTAPDTGQITRVMELVMNRYDPERTGMIKVNNPQSLMDVMWQEEPSLFAVSQGYYALTVKTALALGIDMADSGYLQKTIQGYQSYYIEDHAGKGYLQSFAGNALGDNGEDLKIVSCLDFEPEFLSLYLFDESLLGSRIVRGALESIPVFSGCLMPIIACADGTFFTKERNPFSSGHFWEGGRYANGGSYLRPQYIALAVGKYHGWRPADELMEKRLKVEFETLEDWPVSIEYLDALGNPEKSSDHKVFAWNVFVNRINRWIQDTIDPEFQAGENIL